MRRWLDRKADWPARSWTSATSPLPYHYGQEGDVYHFSYAWIYPAAGS